MDTRRLLIIAAGVVVIVLGVVQFMGGLNELLPAAGVGGDSDIKAASGYATKAAASFAAIAGNTGKIGTVPRQTDTVVAPLLDAVFNVDILKSKPALTSADVGALSDWSKAGVDVSTLYLLAGTGTSDIAVAAKDQKALDQIDANTVRYAPEIGRYMDSEVALTAATAGIIAPAPGTGAGIDEVRSGITTTLGGVVTTLSLDGLDDAWRTARISALTAAAPAVAKLLLPAQCTALHATTDTVGKQLKNPAVQDQLKGFGNALQC